MNDQTHQVALKVSVAYSHCDTRYITQPPSELFPTFYHAIRHLKRSARKIFPGGQTAMREILHMRTINCSCFQSSMNLNYTSLIFSYHFFFVPFLHISFHYFKQPVASLTHNKLKITGYQTKSHLHCKMNEYFPRAKVCL